MWFRVELHKDGSVASCETVEGKLKDGKHVFYVEADTKEKALTFALAWYRKTRDRKNAENRAWRQRRKASGLCREAACRSLPVPGKTRCTEHARAHAELQRQRSSPSGITPRQPVPLEERALRSLEAAKRADVASKDKFRREFGISREHVYVLRIAFREALATYDRNPRNFRNWLVTKLASLGVEADGDKAEPFAFESAAE